MEPSPARKRHAELLSCLGEQVEALTQSHSWREWLMFASRFRTYSLYNQLLILAQHPSATRVAGYRAWQTMGRQVRPGEAGIAILAPLLRRRSEDDETVAPRQLVGFRVVYVFDVAQTEGESPPTLGLPAVQLSGADLLEQLVQVAGRLDITVERVEKGPDDVRGWWDAVRRRITLVTSYPAPSQTRTLLHELAHCFDEPSPLNARAERELVAESAAYLVGSKLGVGMDEASAFYVAAWGGSAERIESLAQRTLHVAAVLEEAIGELVVTLPS